MVVSKRIVIFAMETTNSMSNINENVSKAIDELVKSMMDKVMNRVLVEDPFIPEVHHNNKPVYAALVPDVIFRDSHFERRFVTPFGTFWEKMAHLLGTAYHGHCEKGKNVEGTVGRESLRRIQEVLNRLEHPNKKKERKKPDWKNELAYIRNGGGEPLAVNVTCDILVESQLTGKTYSFELKGPLPNSDQTKVSKEKMFKLLAMNEHIVDEAYYALPYNPYGKRENYSWPFPQRWFDMREDPCVLIGNDFWNLIGGVGTYEAFVGEINKLGAEYKERIYREFIGIDPPKGFDSFTLK